MISIIEQSRSLQKCSVPDVQEVALTNRKEETADFEAAYSCETSLIRVKGEAQVSAKGVVTVKLTNLSL